MGGEIKEVFENLNRHQPGPYRIYEDFKEYLIPSVINSLESLRKLGQPAEINDWKRFLEGHEAR